MALMKNQKILVMGNWKMNPATLEEAKKRFQAIKRAASTHPSLDVVICPPFPYLASLANLAGAQNSSKNKAQIAVGAQDTSSNDIGSAQTGDVNASMIESVGAQYVIVGHSERRAMGDTSSIISKKIQQALKTQMKIVICFGEKERDAEGGYLEVVKSQLKDVLVNIGRKQFQQVILAYEPVWAVGRPSNEADSAYNVHQMVVYIRKCLREMFDATVSSMMPILYGGSANPNNAEDIIYNGEVDGLLVGRASWQADTFTALLNAINGDDKAAKNRNLKETLNKAKSNKQKMYNDRIQQKKKLMEERAKKAKKQAKKSAKKAAKTTAVTKKAKKPSKKSKTHGKTKRIKSRPGKKAQRSKPRKSKM